MNSEEIDSFAAMFKEAPGKAQRESREARSQKERRSQLTDKQRKRGAVRTAQINFRCSPEFLELTRGLAKQLDVSIADVMDEAVAMLAKHYKGPIDA